MAEAFICDYVRTPIGRFGGALAAVRADDLAAVPLKALLARHERVDWAALDDVVLGCANQAGEDNRNVARMALLLAGVPKEVPGSTVNRLCGSGMDALLIAARAIRAGEAELLVAGGVESMSRAPFVMPKAEMAYSRRAEIHDTTIGWRFVNPLLKAQYGVDSMPETAENVAEEFQVARADQDAFALRSQQRAAAAQARGRLAREITPSLKASRSWSPSTSIRAPIPRSSGSHSCRARSARAARSPPATRRASTTARRRSWSRPRPRASATASSRSRAWSAARRSACRRGSWASVRRRPRRSCARAFAGRSARST
jgi:acetyl-CoA acyltransferase